MIFLFQSKSFSSTIKNVEGGDKISINKCFKLNTLKIYFEEMVIILDILIVQESC